MSVKSNLAVAGAAVVIAVPLLGGGQAIYQKNHAQAAADAAALAAADSATGWLDQQEPCAAARTVADAHRAVQLVRCEVNRDTGDAKITTSALTLFGLVYGKALAGPPH